VSVDFPYHVDGRHRTATSTGDDHVRDLIEQVLFTAPGERVMRPDFGCGLLDLVFEPAGDPLATTTEHLVRGALEQFLGQVIVPQAVAVDHADGTLTVRVDYVVRSTQTAATATFTRGAA
jgi:uncharacterized protein